MFNFTPYASSEVILYDFQYELKNLLFNERERVLHNVFLEHSEQLVEPTIYDELRPPLISFLDYKLF